MNGLGDGMRAAVLREIGGIPECAEFPAPAPDEFSAVVEVAAAALKPSDRLSAQGVGYPPTRLPAVVGLDGVGRLADGSRVAFFGPRSPFGGMAEQALVPRGQWFEVPDFADDVTAAAILNPGAAAWKTVVWEGGLRPGESVLVLGATGTSGRIATQLAARQGARVVAAGRNRSVLAGLGTETVAIEGGPRDLADAIAAHGPYDVVVDYLWGAPAEAVFAALPRAGRPRGRVRYVQAGMAAGDTAEIPAMALRRAPVQLTGSGVDGQASPAEAEQAFADLLGLVRDGSLRVEVEAVALTEVAARWSRPDNGRRVVFVP